MSVTFDYIIELYDILDTHTISWPIILLCIFVLTTYVAESRQQTCISCPATPRLASWSFTHPQYPVDQTTQALRWTYPIGMLVILHHMWGLCDHYPGKSDVSAHTIIARGGKHLLSFTLQYMQFQKYKAMHPRKPEGCLCGQSEAQLANLPSIPIATTQPLSTA